MVSLICAFEAGGRLPPRESGLALVIEVLSMCVCRRVRVELIFEI